ncbi:hypothetical protein [Rosettibacter firmus]|uniref:hypothetical protein n=1 Tax=Rosettibacter firmus TaxID=3111522 RepID=UPI00336BE9C8
MKKYLSSFVAGFGAGVLQVVPFIKSFTCCLIIPIASYVAILLDRKATKNFGIVRTKHAFMIGLMTGIYAALFGTMFDIIITFITKNNDIVEMLPELQRMINNFPFDENVKTQVISLLQIVRDEIIQYGFSFIYTLSIIINNFIINTIFGIIGGLISAQIINSRIK